MGGWWVERDTGVVDGLYAFRPTLQADSGCFSLPIWFDNEAECLDFIRREVLGAGLLDEDPQSPEGGDRS